MLILAGRRFLDIIAFVFSRIDLMAGLATRLHLPRQLRAGLVWLSVEETENNGEFF
jgi:hypothetical protein